MKTFNVFLIMLLMGMSFILFSCKTGNKKSAADVDSLQTTYSALEDSVEAAWNTMIADDDQKLANASRLLQEVAYTNTYDKEKYRKLVAQVKKLRAMRYDKASMGQSGKIDQYDSATAQVLYEVMTFATSHPQYKEYPLMKELVKEIQDAQNRVLLMRVDYDYAAKAYNRFISLHQELMEEIDNNGSVKKKPLFELPIE